jgi:WD40 repeat protein
MEPNYYFRLESVYEDESAGTETEIPAIFDLSAVGADEISGCAGKTKAANFIGFANAVAFLSLSSFRPRRRITGNGIMKVMTRMRRTSYTRRSGRIRTRSRAFRFTPDGKTLVTGSRDNTVKLWELPSGEAQGVVSGVWRE